MSERGNAYSSYRNMKEEEKNFMSIFHIKIALSVSNLKASNR